MPPQPNQGLDCGLQLRLNHRRSRRGVQPSGHHAGLLFCGLGIEFGFRPRSALKQVKLSASKPCYKHSKQDRNQTLPPTLYKLIIRVREVVTMVAVATAIYRQLDEKEWFMHEFCSFVCLVVCVVVFCFCLCVCLSLHACACP